MTQERNLTVEGQICPLVRVFPAESRKIWNVHNTKSILVNLFVLIRHLKLMIKYVPLVANVIEPGGPALPARFLVLGPVIIHCVCQPGP
jgi:hypothetical protein